MKTRTISTFAAIAALCFAGASAYAGPKHTAPPSKPVKETLAESCITGDLGIDMVSSYITRGLVLENQGLILQPYADLHFRLYKGAGPVNSITADIGIWESFHDHHPLAPRGSTTSNWFESDFVAGLTLGIDKLAVSPYFKLYQSPSDVFDRAYIGGLRLGYDDRDLLGDFALHPYAKVELNMAGTTGNGNGNGQYYEIGVTPGHSFSGIDLTLPIKAGFGSGGYYLGNRAFGFFSVGIDASYSLNFVPECLGKWSVHGGVTYVRLGGNPGPTSRSGAAGLAPAYFDLNTGTAGVADENQVVFGGGLKVAF